MTTSGKLRVENKVISLKYIRTLATLYHCNFNPLQKTPVSSFLPRLCGNDETGVFEWIFFLRRCLRQNLRHEIQAYVQRAAAVGQIAEGDAVHAGLRYALQAVEADAARCFAIDGVGVGGLRVAAVCRFF